MTDEELSWTLLALCVLFLWTMRGALVRPLLLLLRVCVITVLLGLTVFTCMALLP